MYHITQIKAGSNCYLVTQQDSSILIDTGLKGHEKKILEACQGKNVKLIVLTHGHMDHIQNAAYLAKQLQVPIAMHKDDVVLLQDNLCREMKSNGFMGNVVRFASEMSAKHTENQSFLPDIYLKEGDSLSQYGIDGVVMELPGHTEGSIGILFGDQCLLVGDALMNMFSPGLSLLYENLEEMKRSANKISDLGKIIIYFGHGKAVENRRWVK
jgi:Zn-dependent hydrolases, including glyoxylases